ncbi:hypothetical protein DIPPA_20043 [Diplonema papillatum]|nr:hypothetical protein DIPPA_20043 [Diplonema papillatum]
MCTKHHRMMACSTCTSVAACCKNSHHKCLTHELPMCDTCTLYEDVQCRRPRQCCKRGHHGARPAVKRGPVGQRTRACASKVPEPKAAARAHNQQIGRHHRTVNVQKGRTHRKRGRDDEQAGGSARKKPKRSSRL